jgi:photosystem II stability/assembly factor-like uncharacterized protein
LCVVAIGWWASNFSTNGQTIYNWYSIGPQPIISFDNQNNVIREDIGRVTALAVDPANSSHWLVGAAQGGIWETTDNGVTFDPRTDNQASMAMGAIAFLRGYPLVFAGTGEQNFRGDAYAGAGLLVSHDNGTTWQMLNTNFAKTSFSHIAVRAFDLTNVVVTTVRGGAGVGEESSGHGNVPGAPPRGVFVSGDGGSNFTQVLTGEATALAVDPQDFQQQYAGLGEIYGDPTNGVYRTRDRWQSSELILGPWSTNISLITTNIPIATNTVITCSNSICITNIIITDTNIVLGTNISPVIPGRISMAISPSNPDTLYVGLATTRTNYLADLLGIWVTTNAWADTPTWSQLPSPPVDKDSKGLPRFWYMFDLLVDRANPTNLYLAEFNVWRYSGGWSDLSDWSDTDVHPDNHVMVWVTNRMLLGNDGGVYLSDPGVPGTWENLSAGLRITQFYKGAVDVTGKSVLILGGAQDNFTSLYTGSTAWLFVSGGDGGDCAISTLDPFNDWSVSFSTGTDHHFFNNDVDILRTRNGGLDFNSGADDIDDGLPLSKQFYVHYEKAPQLDDLMIAGTARLWRCTNYFSGTVPVWTPNSPTMLDTNGDPMPISAMAFAPSDTRGLIYAYGTGDGQLLITTNGGTNWNNLDPGGAVPERYVSGLAFSPFNSSILYVALSGFNESTPGHPGHLFKTTSALAPSPVWTDVSPPVNLPNNCLAINPGIETEIYVGTDIGVWHTGNGGSSWTHFGPLDGMPNVAVYDLRFNVSGLPTAFTHGRGAFLLSKINIPILVFIPPDFHPTPNCLTCPPGFAWLNPEDQVTVEIPLQGILPIDTIDLKATLLGSPQVTPITTSQNYGAVKGQGAKVTRSFKFIAHLIGPLAGAGGPPPAGGSCGDTINVVLQLEDAGGVDLGQVSIPYRLGVPSHPMVEDFEVGPPPPMLPPGWVTMAVGADVVWVTTTNPPVNAPQLGEDDFPAPPNTNTSVFVSDAIGVGQSFLISPPFPVSSSSAQLYFREAFAVSNKFDGGILDISINGQPFQEIIQAGGSFVKDGYNTVLSDFNPLGLRPAWSGNSGGWVPVIVNLPAAAAGHFVQLRWHFASSRGMTNGGWFIDSAFITETSCLPPVVDPRILNPRLNGNQFAFTINTVSNRTYYIQYRTNLTDDAWLTQQTVPGNGSPQIITVPLDPLKPRFYRFQVQ